MPPFGFRLMLGSWLAAMAIASTAYAADFSSSTDGPDLSGVRSQIEAKNYREALAQLKTIVVNNAKPDVYSLLGFTLRKTGDRAQAMTYYQKALAADPNHRGALEYQGELFVELGQIDAAKANLARLDKLCASGCEERTDLSEAIRRASVKK
jgi:tetratricopeptide (TPR) repeat protein